MTLHTSDGSWTPKRSPGCLDADLLTPPPKRARGEPPPLLSPAASDASWQLAVTPCANAVGPGADIVMTDTLPELVPQQAAAAQVPVICFGAIGRLPPRRAKAIAAGEVWECMAMTVSSFSKSSQLGTCRGAEEYCCLSVQLEAGLTPHHCLCTADGDKLAILDVVTSRRLLSLGSLDGLQFQAVLRAVDIKKSSKGAFPVSINILGPMSVTVSVSDTLTGLQAYLQHPYFLARGTEYLNPHYYCTGSDREYMTHLVGIDEETVTAKMLSEEIESVMDSLALEDLTSSATYDDISTDLEEHQRQGVEFIRRREDLNRCQETGRHMRLLIGASSSYETETTSTTGGIFADAMGMGKTLTTITAIAVTRLQARTVMTWNAAPNHLYGPTLVVVPSLQLLDVWQSEIQWHVKPGRLVVSVFHGPGRAKTPSAVLQAESDVVLTTYSTLVEDGKKRQENRVLQNITWYRVVLDEAHWIRNPSSRRFQAAKALTSQRRWCLTGTPVQNSLNDLAALVNFLNVPVFSQPAQFRKHILKPLGGDDEDRCRNLRALLVTTCLRRCSACLVLPEVVEERVDVEQTPEEKAELHRALEECRRRMEDLVSRDGSQSGTPKKFNIMFAAMMRARLLCNNGTYQPNVMVEAPGKQVLMEDPDSGLCETCASYDTALRDEDFCPQCGKQTKQHSTKTTISALQALPSFRGPKRADSGSPSLSELSEHSSKLEVLVEKIRRYPPGDKSIVFSAWTSTLDIVQQLLIRNEIPFCRIDGKVDASQRATIIQEFSEKLHIPVIMMTIGTGAVGLTITAANKVHLVEPQWNPFVEEQAIARAVRMGQKRQVTIIRYVVKGSVEKNILDLQTKKSNLAKFTIDQGDRSSENLQDLRFILDI